MEYEVWRVKDTGTWQRDSRLRNVEPRDRRTEYGESSKESEKGRMGCGEWGVGQGERIMECGLWRMGNRLIGYSRKLANAYGDWR
jgi:hypothetical protein